MNGKFKKNIVCLSILCLLVVLIFLLEAPKQKQNIKSDTLTKNEEPMGYLEEKEYIVKKPNDSEEEQSIDQQEQEIEASKTIDVDLTEDIKESKETVNVSLYEENGIRDYDKNYFNTHEITDNQFDGYGEYR